MPLKKGTHTSFGTQVYLVLGAGLTLLVQGKTFMEHDAFQSLLKGSVMEKSVGPWL